MGISRNVNCCSMHRGRIFDPERSRLEAQSQRDCASKPRVARNELPWEGKWKTVQPQRPKGLRPPRWGRNHNKMRVKRRRLLDFKRILRSNHSWKCEFRLWRP